MFMTTLFLLLCYQQLFCKSCHLLHTTQLKKDWSDVIDDLFAEKQRLCINKQESKVSRWLCEWFYLASFRCSTNWLNLLVGALWENTQKYTSFCCHPNTETVGKTRTAISRIEVMARGGSGKIRRNSRTLRSSPGSDSDHRIAWWGARSKCTFKSNLPLIDLPLLCLFFFLHIVKQAVVLKQSECILQTARLCGTTRLIFDSEELVLTCQSTEIEGTDASIATSLPTASSAVLHASVSSSAPTESSTQNRTRNRRVLFTEPIESAHLACHTGFSTDCKKPPEFQSTADKQSLYYR